MKEYMISTADHLRYNVNLTKLIMTNTSNQVMSTNGRAIMVNKYYDQVLLH